MVPLPAATEDGRSGHGCEAGANVHGEEDSRRGCKLPRRVDKQEAAGTGMNPASRGATNSPASTSLASLCTSSLSVAVRSSAGGESVAIWERHEVFRPTQATTRATSKL